MHKHSASGVTYEYELIWNVSEIYVIEISLVDLISICHNCYKYDQNCTLHDLCLRIITCR